MHSARTWRTEEQRYHPDTVSRQSWPYRHRILEPVTPSPATRDWTTPFDGDLGDDLALALRLADAADAVSMARFDASDLDVRLKADASHVTEADLATEKAIRSLLQQERPEDGVFGEEFGSSGESRRRWIIDPIDGTANYLKGIPMWATLIALEIDGVPRVGVVSQPSIGRRWWGATGQGAWTDSESGPRRIAVSAISTLSEASVSFQSVQQWDEASRIDDLLRLTRAVWRDRGYGDAWPYMLLAEGRLELVAEFDVKEYDIAAHVPIVHEAGGRFTDIDGADSLSSRSSLATNGILHETFVSFLSSHTDTSHTDRETA